MSAFSPLSAFSPRFTNLLNWGQLLLMFAEFVQIGSVLIMVAVL